MVGVGVRRQGGDKSFRDIRQFHTRLGSEHLNVDGRLDGYSDTLRYV